MPGPAEPWEALGFSVADGRVEVGGVRLQLEANQPGWTLAGIDEVADIDGLSTAVTQDGVPAPRAATPGGGADLGGGAHPGGGGRATHPNGATAIDHVVVFSPDFDRTQLALEQAGITLSRIRDGGGFRQGFRRLGPAILELVEAKQAPAGPATFWGVVVTVADLPALAERLGDRLSPIRAAVQSGRHIATLRRTPGLTLKLAFMD